MAFFTIVGTGAGTEQYLLPEAKKVIDEADVLIGGERNLAPWNGFNDKKCFIIKTPIIEIVNIIRTHYEHEKVVVLVSGDPGFYSILDFLTKHFAKEELIIIPGISSMQIAFARLALPWHDAIILNLHGRAINTLDNYINEPKLALLTDPLNTPLNICRYLVKNGRNQGLINICSQLGYPEEKIIAFNLNCYSDFALNEIPGPIVMVILNE